MKWTKEIPNWPILPPSIEYVRILLFLTRFPAPLFPLSSFFLGSHFLVYFFFNKLVLNRELCPSSGKFFLPSWGITITVVGRPYISFFPFEQNPYQETARIFEDLRRRSRKTNTPHLQRKPTCRYIHIHPHGPRPYLSLSTVCTHIFIIFRSKRGREEEEQREILLVFPFLFVFSPPDLLSVFDNVYLFSKINFTIRLLINPWKLFNLFSRLGFFEKREKKKPLKKLILIS